MAELAWWQRGIVYEIYPRSFQDSNGDGIGDLPGIASRLDYLAWLGIDAIWIAPIYVSPMADHGYDISWHYDIDPVFGTLADFDALIAKAHALGLKVIMDFVPNHTSDRHPWFLESRSSKHDRKRDWYIWRDPTEDGSRPNNWRSNFGGSAWEFDEATGQYYYHAFLKEQPDLNWRNREVCNAMFEVLRFWLDRGVDGFRVDVMWHLIKDDAFRDNPPDPGYRPGDPGIREFLQVYSADRPEVHRIVADMRKVIDAYPDRVLIGEIYLPLERLVAYYGQQLSGANLPFNFQLIEAPWHARQVGRIIREYEAALPEGGWPNWVLSNHDKPRIASRTGVSQARVAAMLLLALRGTPTLYYGDEIGMEGASIPADQARDPWERSEPGLGVSRDPARTPMQWDASPNAGFTTGRPWLPLEPAYQTRNVEALAADPKSMLTLVRRLIALRRERPVLRQGGYHRIEAEGDVLAFERTLGEEHLLVLLNFGREQVTVPLTQERGRIMLSTTLEREGESLGPEATLAPDEGVIVEAFR